MDNLRALEAQCRALMIPRDRWHEVPGIARAWECLAVARLADRIQTEERIGRKSAEESACIRLGISPDTYRSRVRDWYPAAA